MHLEGKIALVTGASRGIGRAIALKLAKSGATIIVNYAGNVKAAEEVGRMIVDNGGKAMLVQANVTDGQAVLDMVKKVMDAYGRIDILVNNAGITRDSLLMRMSEKDWDDVLDTNLKGAFQCTKAVIKIMSKQRVGRIVNITSVVGVTGNVGQANYTAAKAGLIGFSKSIAQEMASRGITVNLVAPGFIETEMTDVVPEKIRDTMLSTIPLARAGKPEDVANAVAFLVSDEASYITGQTLHVNGGMVM